MDAAHLHLVLNHFPVIGTVITMFLLFIGLVKKSDDVKKSAMLVLILTAFVTIPVYVSGDGAQQIIEGNYDDVDEEYIDEHEDFALYSFIAMNLTGAIAILSMFLYRKPKTLPDSFVIIMFVLVLTVNGMMAYTANLGGKIHHPEIRGTSSEKSGYKSTDDRKDEGSVKEHKDASEKEKHKGKDDDEK